MVNWWQQLSPSLREQIQIVLITALITVSLTNILPKFIWPVIVSICRRFKELLYNQVAGWTVFNRWGLARYRRQVNRRLERIINPWSTQRILLSDVFVPVRVQIDFSMPHISGMRRNVEISDLAAAVRNLDRFVLVGEPGAGKSTSLRSVALAAMRGTLRPGGRRKVPVFIELKEFDPSASSLTDYVVQRFSEFGFPDATKFVNRQLQEGAMILLLDALDEVSMDHAGQVCREILSTCDRYPRASVIVSCRTAVYGCQLDAAVDDVVALTDFNDIQMTTLLNRWTFPPDRSPVMLMQLFHQRPRIHAICRNPLMFTIVVSLYTEQDFELPRSRSEFYRTCVLALLTRWDRARNIQRRHNRFTWHQKSQVLQRLAFRLHDEDPSGRDLAFEDLVDYVGGILPQIGLQDSQAEAMIIEVIQNSGLLMYVGPQKVRFAHRTFQEYFTAKEIESRHEPGFLVAKYRSSPTHWREVALLYCGISDKSPAFVSPFIQDEPAFAARCIRDGDSVEVGMAESVLDRLQQALSLCEQDPGDTVQALAALAGDERRQWSLRAFELLSEYTRSGEGQQKRMALTAMASVGTSASASELAKALVDEETRFVARDSLKQLGKTGLAPVNQVLCDTEDVDLKKTCIEICGQCTDPEVVNVLLPLLGKEHDGLRMAASFELSHLLRFPQIEYTLSIAGESHFQKSPLALQAEKLSKWVWPSNSPRTSGVEGDAQLAIIAGHLVANLAEENVSEFLDRPLTPDVRIALPICIELRNKLRPDDYFFGITDRLLGLPDGVLPSAGPSLNTPRGTLPDAESPAPQHPTTEPAQTPLPSSEWVPPSPVQGTALPSEWVPPSPTQGTALPSEWVPPPMHGTDVPLESVSPPTDGMALSSESAPPAPGSLPLKRAVEAEPGEYKATIVLDRFVEPVTTPRAHAIVRRIFRRDTGKLREQWRTAHMPLAKKPKAGLSSRGVARVLAGVQMFAAGMAAIESRAVAFSVLLILNTLAAVCWSRLLQMRFASALFALPAGAASFIQDLRQRTWRNFRELSLTVTSLGLILGWIWLTGEFLVILGLDRPWGMTLAVVVGVLTNLLYAVDYRIRRNNPFPELLTTLENISIDHDSEVGPRTNGPPEPPITPPGRGTMDLLTMTPSK